MGGTVGGSPPYISAGANQLSSVSQAVQAASPAFDHAGSQASAAAGDASVSAAVDRFRAAWTRFSLDAAAQLATAAMLAQHSAEDLDAAGGTHGPGTSRAR